MAHSDDVSSFAMYGMGRRSHILRVREARTVGITLSYFFVKINYLYVCT